MSLDRFAAPEAAARTVQCSSAPGAVCAPCVPRLRAAPGDGAHQDGLDDGLGVHPRGARPVLHERPPPARQADGPERGREDGTRERRQRGVLRDAQAAQRGLLRRGAGEVDPEVHRAARRSDPQGPDVHAGRDAAGQAAGKAQSGALGGGGSGAAADGAAAAATTAGGAAGPGAGGGVGREGGRVEDQGAEQVGDVDELAVAQRFAVAAARMW